MKFLKSQSSSSVQQPSSIELLENVNTSKRLVHSHLPWQLLPNSIQSGSSKPKIVYITRNPKDVVVSYFHHRVLFEGFLGSMDDFVDLFTNDAGIPWYGAKCRCSYAVSLLTISFYLHTNITKVLFSSVRYAPFWNHVQEFWERRDEPNILFLTYEQMQMVRYLVFLNLVSLYLSLPTHVYIF